MYKKFYDYFISEQGQVYSLINNKFLKGEITKATIELAKELLN